MDIITIVNEIQYKLDVDVLSRQPFILEYTQYGYCEGVNLYISDNSVEIKIEIWNSENDEREWIEEKNDYEDFEVFLKRKVELSIKNLKLLYEKLNQ